MSVLSLATAPAPSAVHSESKQIHRNRPGAMPARAERRTRTAWHFYCYLLFCDLSIYALESSHISVSGAFLFNGVHSIPQCRCPRFYASTACSRPWGTAGAAQSFGASVCSVSALGVSALGRKAKQGTQSCQGEGEGRRLCCLCRMVRLSAQRVLGTPGSSKCEGLRSEHSGRATGVAAQEFPGGCVGHDPNAGQDCAPSPGERGSHLPHVDPSGAR